MSPTLQVMRQPRPNARASLLAPGRGCDTLLTLCQSHFVKLGDGKPWLSYQIPPIQLAEPLRFSVPSSVKWGQQNLPGALSGSQRRSMCQALGLGQQRELTWQ